MTGLKSRLDAFSDGIIAIIITIMVMHVIQLVDFTVQEYQALLKSIFIYFVSFCFVADLWYQHVLIINGMKEISRPVLVSNLLFLFFLSLKPVATKIMTQKTSLINVVVFGIHMIIVNVFLFILRLSVLKFRTQSTPRVYPLFRKAYFVEWMRGAMMNVILTGLAFVIPQ